MAGSMLASFSFDPLRNSLCNSLPKASSFQYAECFGKRGYETARPAGVLNVRQATPVSFTLMLWLNTPSSFARQRACSFLLVACEDEASVKHSLPEALVNHSAALLFVRAGRVWQIEAGDNDLY